MTASTRIPAPFDAISASLTTTALAASAEPGWHPAPAEFAYFATVPERDAYLAEHPDATAWNLDRATGEWHEVTPPADDDESREANTFDMLKVADLMRAKGVYAYCEQTGGGCATIYAGLATEQDGYRTVAYDREGNRPFAAGPGSWWTYATARGHYGEFYYGTDDQGESEPDVLPFDPTLTEEMIAARCVEWYRANVDEQAWQARLAEENSDLLTAAEREALGLTSSYDTRWPHRERDLDDDERERLAEHRMDATMRAQMATDPEAGGPADPSLPEVEHDDPAPNPELVQVLAASLVTLRLSPEVAQALCEVADMRYEELRVYEGDIDTDAEREQYRLLGLALNALDAAGVRVEH